MVQDHGHIGIYHMSSLMTFRKVSKGKLTERKLLGFCGSSALGIIVFQSLNNAYVNIMLQFKYVGIMVLLA